MLLMNLFQMRIIGCLLDKSDGKIRENVTQNIKNIKNITLILM